MRKLLACLPIIAAACVAVPPRPPAAPAPTFVPARFFAGHTEGRGTLRSALTSAKPVVVHGEGRVDAAGVLTLDQTVIEGDKPAMMRSWNFRPAAAGHYTGTLSDAAGPVAGDVSGNRLHLHFRMHGGVVADQAIDLAPDGASAHNRMTFRKFGIVVAALDETIRRVP